MTWYRMSTVPGDLSPREYDNVPATVTYPTATTAIVAHPLGDEHDNLIRTVARLIARGLTVTIARGGTP